MSRVTPARVRELLVYNPDTGIFTNRVQRGRSKQGTIVGTINANGYLVIRIDNELHYGHRLAWAYMTGEWPNPMVDHDDTDKSNNVWNNLRESNASQNGANRKCNINSKTGIKGVHFCNFYGKFKAEIGVNGHKFTIGYYKTLDEAAAAYAGAAALAFREFSRRD